MPAERWTLLIDNLKGKIMFDLLDNALYGMVSDGSEIRQVYKLLQEEVDR